MLGDVALENSPSGMMDDEKAVEQTAAKSRYREEVHFSYSFAMIAQESGPAPCRLSISGSLSHPPQNGSLRNLESEHSQFAMNPRRTPSGVFPYHLEDQLAKFWARRFAPYGNMFK